MPKIFRWLILATLPFLTLACALTSTQPPHTRDPRLTLDPLFSTHAVLQRGMELPVWGKDWPGQRVEVELAGQHAAATADADGNWTAKLPALEAGGPFTLIARGSRTLQVQDILVGEVWLCSGQSNMWWALHETQNAAAVAQAADFPQIRLLTVPQVLAPTPQDELTTATWNVCTPAVAYDFSSVGFYFARDLNQQLKVPIGMICAAWPGTRLEGWLPPATYRHDSRLHADMQAFEKGIKDPEASKKQADARFAKWLQKNARVDTGNEGEKRGWSAADYDDSPWRPMILPTIWDFHDMWIDGSVWFRRSVDLPANWAGQPLRLRLGTIDDNDITYFNGVRVGASEGDYISRDYEIPAGLVRAGRNSIAVRVFDRFHWGGFKGQQFELALADTGSTDTATINLRGPWKFQVERAFLPVLEPAPGGPMEPWSAQAPTRLFNGMVAPLIPYAIRGALWYQGETNGSYPPSYYPLLPLLIRSWREQWGQGDFPFYYVQLAPFELGPTIASPNWAYIREAQLQTLRLEPNTAMAVIVDHGDKYDIHPRAKQPVGHRLALAALARDYGFPLEYSGPLYESYQLLPGAVQIQFTHAEGLHTSGTQQLKGFGIAGGDHLFVPAEARIEGDTIVVSSPRVATPLAVRYGWANCPDLNLFNAAGLPASPFRTDAWDDARRELPVFNPTPAIGELPYTGL